MHSNHMKHHQISCQRRVFVAWLLLLGASQDCHAQDTDTDDTFAKLAYRPRFMVQQVVRTKAWNEGRRNVLDWGCGAGRVPHTSLP